MTNQDLNKYIEKHYKKFLDYANFHASRNGLTNCGPELLNYVLEVALVDMDREKVLSLLNKKYGNYNELHTYILGMIKINAFSPRSDFHRKVLNRLPIDDNIEVSHLKLLDDDVDGQHQNDSDTMAMRMRFLREVSERVLTADELRVFNHKYLNGEYLSLLDGREEVKYKAMNHAESKLRTMVRFCHFLMKDETLSLSNN